MQLADRLSRLGTETAFAVSAEATISRGVRGMVLYRYL